MPGAAEAPPVPASRARDTKERLLDAAERLFAERGFEGTSLRAVTQAADASVSAANYHFGSKEELLRATLRRRVEPVNRRRLDRLDALESAESGEPAVEAVLEAFLRPIFEIRAISPEAPAHYRHVAARLFSDPPDLVASLKRDLFGVVNERFVAALARALPGRSRDDVELGFQLTVGCMVHVIGGHLVSQHGKGDTGGFGDEALLARLLAYGAAGLRAVADATARPSRAPGGAAP